MRIWSRILGLLVVLWAVLSISSAPVAAANLDTVADHVLGQPDFLSNAPNNGGPSANSLHAPFGMARDKQGNLFVADANNNRVLEYNTPLSNSTAANHVLGQPDFSSITVNTGGLSAQTLSDPSGVAVDDQGDLFVADSGNNRVLEYAAPVTTHAAATHVFGQPDFTSNSPNNAGISAASLSVPTGAALDTQGNLYVTDSGNNRVLVYYAPLTTHAGAAIVFGQPDFVSHSANNGGVSAHSLVAPGGVALDSQGNLYVADSLNHRALEYDTPLSSDVNADRVFGQPGFTSSTINNGGVSANSLFYPFGLALDAQGNLFVADTFNNRVLEYDRPVGGDATADRVFGQPNFTSNTTNNGGVSASSLYGNHSVTLDAQGDLFAGDTGNNRVLEYDVPVPYDVPALTDISPSIVAAGSPAFVLTVNGSGFVPGTLVRWNGSPRPTTFLSSLRLQASIPAGDVNAGGPFAISVFTPSPGGGASASLALTLYARQGQDATADGELGQPNFNASDPNNPVLSGGANRLASPWNVAVDPQTGRLFVADLENHRVLSWPSAPSFANGQAADLVIGQPDFSSTIPNNGGLSAKSLHFPRSLALDPRGNLYIADSGNSRVLVVSPPFSSGMAASLVFGQGGSFATGIPNNGGVSANSLDFPGGITLDSRGNLFVADTGNNRVLEYDTPLSAGTTADHVFGQPNYTSNTLNNGGISAFSLGGPAGVAVDTQGNLYIADRVNSRALEYNNPLNFGAAAARVFGQPNFTSNTINNGGVSATSLNIPNGIAVDPQGDLYVADTENSRLLEYDTPLSKDSTADRVFGQPNFSTNNFNNGGTSASSLNYPSGVAVDTRGNLYAADSNNSRVLEYDIPVAYSLPVLSSLSPGILSAGSPAFTLTVNGSGFVPASQIRWNGSDRTTTFLNSAQLEAAIPAGDVAAGGPFAVTVFTPAPGGGVSSLVNLTLYTRLRQDVTADGVLGQPDFISELPDNPRMPGLANRLAYPYEAVLDPHTGRLFVSDTINHRVLSWPNAPAFANAQAADLVIGQPDPLSISSADTASAKNLLVPFGLALDPQGDLYVADNGFSRVLVYKPPFKTGMAAFLVFGQGGSFTTGLPNNGGISANSLYQPAGVALDAQGNLYIADSFNNRVLEYDTPLNKDTTADRVFGQPNFTSNTLNNGGVSASSLFSPEGVALDSLGNLYVTDSSNNRVLEYDTPLGGDTHGDHVFGQPNFTSSTLNNGGVSANGLNNPFGAALDTFGNLYISDSYNHRVLEYDTPLSRDATADRVFGQPNFTSNTFNNGGISANTLKFPFGAALDPRGNLYVADTNNSRLLEYDRPVPPKSVYLPLTQR